MSQPKSTNIVVSLSLIIIDDLVLLLYEDVDTQVLHLQAITGTPQDEPQPSIVKYCIISNLVLRVEDAED